MTGESKPRIVSFPTEEEAKLAFEGYALALGRAIYAWNFLLERLARLFVVVVDADRHRLLRVWYAVDSDRTKIGMLREAIQASSEGRWLPNMPSARKDLDWLCVEAQNLADPRNNAAHAPATLVSDPDGHRMMASPFSLNVRAKKMSGQDLLVEFSWLEGWADELEICGEG